jgi:hypothetical protein
MTVKQRLHQLVDLLDDRDAAEALVYLDQLVADAPNAGTASQREVGGVDVADREELLRLARPITADDPLWNIVGLIDVEDDGPRDVSSNKHKYLVDAYSDLHDR